MVTSIERMGSRDKQPCILSLGYSSYSHAILSMYLGLIESKPQVTFGIKEIVYIEHLAYCWLLISGSGSYCHDYHHLR